MAESFSQMELDNNTETEYQNVFRTNTTFLQDFVVPKKVLFAVIAVLSIFGNSLFSVVLVRKRSMLRRPYNKLLLTLSVTDLLTGSVLIFTPDFILDKDWLQVPDTLTGELYCRIIYNRLLIFLFGKASILTATFLAVERWYSILKPIKYRLVFSRRRLWASIVCIWISSILLQMPKAFEISAFNHTCKYDHSSTESQAVAIVYVWVTFFLPSFIIWGTFAQIRNSFRRSLRMKRNNPGRTASQRLLGVCALAACIMTLCWVPVQITYILSCFDIVEIGGNIHHVNQMLSMSNSFINPWIFCLANKEYRDEFRSLLASICSRSHSVCIRKEVGHPLTELQGLPIRALYIYTNDLIDKYEKNYHFGGSKTDDSLDTQL